MSTSEQTYGIMHHDWDSVNQNQLTHNQYCNDGCHVISSGTSFPIGQHEKDIYYRSDSHRWYIYDGSNWTDLTFRQSDISALSATQLNLNAVAGTKTSDLGNLWSKVTKIAYGDTSFSNQNLNTTNSPTFVTLTGTTSIVTDKVALRSSAAQYSSTNQLLKGVLYLENALGFKVPFKVERYDTATTSWIDITASATWALINDNKPSTHVALGPFCEADHTGKIRIYYDAGGQWRTPADTLVINRQHFSYIDAVIVEQADNTAITVNVNSLLNYSTPLSGGDAIAVLPTGNWWRRYLRIELDIRETNASYYTELYLRELMYMSPGYYASSRMFDSLIPIDWNYNREVYFYNLIRPSVNNSYDLGASSYKWKNGYFGGNISIDGTVDGVDISALLIKTTKVTNLATIWDKTTKIAIGDTTITKSDIGLSNVENTKLSTWIGTTNITMVGTITTGIWQGNVIAETYLNLTSVVPITRKVNGHALSTDISVTKSDIGLGNVENTALSSWAGSGFITSLGTIATGVWQGSVIDKDYIDPEAKGMLDAEKTKFADGATNSVIVTNPAYSSEYVTPTNGSSSSDFSNTVPTTLGGYLETYPNNRAVGYAQGYWWSVGSGNKISLYKSIDAKTWTSVTTDIVGTVQGGTASLVIDSSNYIHVVVYSNHYQNNPILYRRGLLNSDGTVTWSATVQTALGGVSSHSYYVRGVAVTPNNHVYIMVADKIGTTSYGYVIKNNNTNGTWSTASGYPLYTENSGSVAIYRAAIVARSDNSLVIVDTKYISGDTPLFYTTLSSSGVLGTRTQVSSMNMLNYVMECFSAIDDNNDGIEIVYYNSSKIYSRTLSSSNVLSSELDITTGKFPSSYVPSCGIAISKKGVGTDIMVFTIGNNYYPYAIERVSSTWDSSWFLISNTTAGDSYTGGSSAPMYANGRYFYYPMVSITNGRGVIVITKINYSLSKVFDNNTTTQWRPLPVNNVTNTYCEVSFAQSIISGCKVYWGADANYRPSSFKFQAYENGSWVDKLTVSSQPSEGWAEYSWTNPSYTYKIRLVLLTAGATGSEVYEIAVYSPTWAKHYHNWTI